MKGFKKGSNNTHQQLLVFDVEEKLTEIISHLEEKLNECSIEVNNVSVEYTQKMYEKFFSCYIECNGMTLYNTLYSHDKLDKLLKDTWLIVWPNSVKNDRGTFFELISQ